MKGGGRVFPASQFFLGDIYSRPPDPAVLTRRKGGIGGVVSAGIGQSER